VKLKRLIKSKIDVSITQDRSNWCANFQFKRSWFGLHHSRGWPHSMPALGQRIFLVSLTFYHDNVMYSHSKTAV